jgi:hypothetical protein
MLAAQLAASEEEFSSMELYNKPLSRSGDRIFDMRFTRQVYRWPPDLTFSYGGLSESHLKNHCLSFAGSDGRIPYANSRSRSKFLLPCPGAGHVSVVTGRGPSSASRLRTPYRQTRKWRSPRVVTAAQLVWKVSYCSTRKLVAKFTRVHHCSLPRAL